MSPIPSILPHNVKNAICTFVPSKLFVSRNILIVGLGILIFFFRF